MRGKAIKVPSEPDAEAVNPPQAGKEALTEVKTGGRRRRPAQATSKRSAKLVSAAKNDTNESPKSGAVLVAPKKIPGYPNLNNGRWEPGVSGNPSGLSSIRRQYEGVVADHMAAMSATEHAYVIDGEEVVMSRGDKILDAIFRKAERGDKGAAALIWARLCPAEQLSRTHRTNVNVAPSVLEVLARLKESTGDAVLPAEEVFNDAT